MQNAGLDEAQAGIKTAGRNTNNLRYADDATLMVVYLHKESWAPKNWCFWTVVLEKTLESPLDCKEILKEISPEYSLEGLMLKLKLQYFGHLMQRTDSLEKTHPGKDWKQEEKGTMEDEIVGWHHRLDRHEFEQAPGVCDEQGSLVCSGPWNCMVARSQTQLSDWTDWMNFKN